MGTWQAQERSGPPVRSPTEIQIISLTNLSTAIITATAATTTTTIAGFTDRFGTFDRRSSTTHSLTLTGCICECCPRWHLLRPHAACRRGWHGPNCLKKPPLFGVRNKLSLLSDHAPDWHSPQATILTMRLRPPQVSAPPPPPSPPRTSPCPPCPPP